MQSEGSSIFLGKVMRTAVLFCFVLLAMDVSFEVSSCSERE